MSTLQQFIRALQSLPGVGPKSAQRMAYYLLQRPKEKSIQFATTVLDAIHTIQSCTKCRYFTEDEFCHICANIERDRSIICIVDSPMALEAIEQMRSYQGTYFVLSGKISPLDGLGPEDIGLLALQARLKTEPISELIFAIPPSIEGQTTLYFIKDMIKSSSISLTQLAQGIPTIGELDLLDTYTIHTAFEHRRLISEQG
jgi:recombination protein RecR